MSVHTSTSKFCGFCKNLGKPVSVYCSHVVKDCVELANTECRYCHELGHTVKQCPKNRGHRRPEPRRPEPRRPEPRHPEPRRPEPRRLEPIIKSDPRNVFAQMSDDCEMPGDKSKRLDEGCPAKQYSKPIAGAWGKNRAVDLVCTDKAWNFTKPKSPEIYSEVLFSWNLNDYDDDDAPMECQKFHPVRTCWADDE